MGSPEGLPSSGNFKVGLRVAKSQGAHAAAGGSGLKQTSKPALSSKLKCSGCRVEMRFYLITRGQVELYRYPIPSLSDFHLRPYPNDIVCIVELFFPVMLSL